MGFCHCITITYTNTYGLPRLFPISDCLHQNGYLHLCQLANEAQQVNGAKELAALCPGMTLGLAKLLLKYAAKDCQEIKSHH